MKLAAVLAAGTGCCGNMAYCAGVFLKLPNHLEGLFKLELLGPTPRVQMAECAFLTSSPSKELLLVVQTWRHTGKWPSAPSKKTPEKSLSGLRINLQ